MSLSPKGLQIPATVDTGLRIEALNFALRYAPPENQSPTPEVAVAAAETYLAFLSGGDAQNT